MSITAFSRWKGGNPAEIIAAAKLAREFMMKHGAQSVRLSRFHHGQFLGDWLVIVRYVDWAAYGKGMDGLSKDAAYQALVAKVSGMAQMVGRSILTDHDIE